MANKNKISSSINEESEHKRSLEIANLTTEYERSTHAVELIAKDEDLRKIRVRKLLLEDEVDHLNERLANEADQNDHQAKRVDALMEQSAEADNKSQKILNDLRSKSRDLEILRAELSAMANVSSDATKLLTEKLTLSREVAALKPEIESLRDQVASHNDTLAEKLALQRQLTTVQVELENAQRTIQRNTAKEAKNHDRSEFEIQLDEVHQRLREANRARKEAEREVERLVGELETTHSLEKKSRKGLKNEAELDTRLSELQSQLKAANQGRKEAEKALESMTNQLESASKDTDKASKKSKKDEKVGELRKQISELKRQVDIEAKQGQEYQLKAEHSGLELQAAKSKAQPSTEDSQESQVMKAKLDSLRKELQAERKERQKAAKMLEKESTAWEAQKSLLDDKLEQFRTKLRSTKEKLKATEHQLEEAQAAATNVPQGPGRNSRKRGASQMDETMLGTPGDGPQIKRNKRAGSLLQRAAPGEKSSFSITPFLNRTMSLAPESPKAAEQPVAEPQKAATIELAQIVETVESVDPPIIAADSPLLVVVDKPTKKVKPKVLSQASSSKHNARSRKSVRPPTLEKVLEEPSMLEQNPSTVTKSISDVQRESTTSRPSTTASAEPTLTLKLKAPNQKPRKSLMSFASFAEEPAPEKRKKRKLGAGASAPKTLFDEDDDDKMPSKPIPGRGFFGAKASAKPFLFGAKKGQPNAAANIAFQFSPLKKDRKGSASFIAG